MKNKHMNVSGTSLNVADSVPETAGVPETGVPETAAPVTPIEERVALGQRIGQVAALVGGNASLARMCGCSEPVIRKWRAAKSQPVTSALIAMAGAAGVSLVWLATGDGPMYTGEHWGDGSGSTAGLVTVDWSAVSKGPKRSSGRRAHAPKEPVAAPDGTDQYDVSGGLSPAYGGVKSAVSLAVAALGDQSKSIDPERLAEIIDATHQLLQSRADPAQIRRLIAAAAGR